MSIAAVLGEKARRDIVNELQAGMSEAAGLLERSSRSGYPSLDRWTSCIEALPEREFRWLLVASIACLGSYTRSGAVTAAVVCELNHLATVQHDRIRDGDHRSSRAENSGLVLAGDHLLTAAAQLVSTLGLRAVELQSRTAARLVSGQIRGVAGPRPDEDPVEHHLSVIADRVGALTQTCTGLGAIVAGLDGTDGEDPGFLDAVLLFGEQVGVVRRLRAESECLAAEGQDGAADGWMTDSLPLAWLKRLLAGDAGVDGLLREAMTQGPARQAARELLRQHNVMDRVRHAAEEWTEAAEASARAIADGWQRELLLKLCRPF